MCEAASQTVAFVGSTTVQSSGSEGQTVFQLWHWLRELAPVPQTSFAAGELRRNARLQWVKGTRCRSIPLRGSSALPQSLLRSRGRRAATQIPQQSHRRNYGTGCFPALTLTSSNAVAHGRMGPRPRRPQQSVGQARVRRDQRTARDTSSRRYVRFRSRIGLLRSSGCARCND